MSALTLFGYTPPPRFDYIPWVSARIEESATESGSFTEVETIPLVPVDTDPRNPYPRGFTTELATADNWYRVVWVASDASESDATAPVQFRDTVLTTAFGTLAELKTLLKIQNTDSDDALNRVLLAAAGEIVHEIGENTTLNGWKLALVTEVNLERAAEHWAQLKSPFGFLGLSSIEIHSTPAVAARDSWDRHAYKLTPVKDEWGIA